MKKLTTCEHCQILILNHPKKNTDFLQQMVTTIFNQCWYTQFKMEGDGEHYVTHSLHFSVTYYKIFNTDNTNARHWT